MAEAKKKGWAIISMTSDWKRIFPFEQYLIDRPTENN
jgi:hypothetical protein